MDAFFVLALLRDLAGGLAHIHASPLGAHGRLRSSLCTVDDRWVAKVSYYGLTFLRNEKTRESQGLPSC